MRSTSSSDISSEKAHTFTPTDLATADFIASSNPYLFVFTEGSGIAAPVKKLRGAGVGMIGHAAGFRERAIAAEVIREAGRSK